MAAHSAEYVTLGLAPLSRFGPRQTSDATWLRLVLGWVRAHGRRFYNFDGLDAFKAKFQPEWWEPVYAIARTGHGRTFPPRALWAIAGAFGGRAAAQEARWIAARRERGESTARRASNPSGGRD